MEAFALSPDGPRPALSQRLLSDDRLLRLIAAGNAQAFGAVYARYHAPLYSYCRSIVRDPDDARDALQNTMLKALAALGREGGRDVALKPWLFRIAHNESISLLRRRRPSEPLTDAVSPPVAGADRVAISRERLAQLVSDLQALPERQRGALLMREVSGLSYEEIAGALCISEGAARQTVFEARSALAEYGEGREVACEHIRSISDGDGRALRARRVRAHLRACDGCREFHDGLRARKRELAMLAPALSGGSAMALLQSVIGSGALDSAGVAAGGAGLLGGAGTLLGGGAAKGVVALVAVTAAGAGATQISARPAVTHRTARAVDARAIAPATTPVARPAPVIVRGAAARKAAATSAAPAAAHRTAHAAGFSRTTTEMPDSRPTHRTPSDRAAGGDGSTERGDNAGAQDRRTHGDDQRDPPREQGQRVERSADSTPQPREQAAAPADPTSQVAPELAGREPRQPRSADPGPPAAADQPAAPVPAPDPAAPPVTG